MDSLIATNVIDNIYVIAVWDREWNSFNNCYLIDSEQKILIDTGRKEHVDFLLRGLKKLDFVPDDISVIVATHNHIDHIGAIEYFPNAKKFIHIKDYIRLSEEIRTHFQTVENDLGEIDKLRYTLVDFHTTGSVVFFEKDNSVVFTGDHICFCGASLTKGLVLRMDNSIRSAILQFYKDWISNPEALNKYDFNQYFKGVRIIRDLNPRFLCTGHGPIVYGGVTELLDEVLNLSLLPS